MGDTLLVRYALLEAYQLLLLPCSGAGAAIACKQGCLSRMEVGPDVFCAAASPLCVPLTESGAKSVMIRSFTLSEYISSILLVKCCQLPLAIAACQEFWHAEQAL